MLRNIKMYESVPALIEPIPIVVDLNKLNADITKIGSFVDYSATARCLSSPTKQSTITLTYPKNIPEEFVNKLGELRSKFVGPITSGEGPLMEKYNLSTAHFTEMHQIVKDSYVKVIADQINEYHANKYGSGQVAWIHSPSLGPGIGFSMHRDRHCVARYHIALATNDYSYMLAEESNEIKAVHIPADGRIWQLNNNILHSAINFAPVNYPNVVRTHLIFSMSN
jgi:hypothetical protein